MHLYDWEKTNDKQEWENSVIARGLVACITSRSQQRLSKLMRQFNGAGKKKCEKITEQMIKQEPDDYRYCDFCFLSFMWSHFHEIFKQSVKFNNMTNSPDMFNTLIPKLIEVCVQEYAKIKSLKHHMEVETETAPGFKKTFESFSGQLMPDKFKFEKIFSEKLANATGNQERYDSFCYNVKFFFKILITTELPCDDFYLYVCFALFGCPLVVAIVSGIILYLCRFLMDPCLEKRCEKKRLRRCNVKYADLKTEIKKGGVETGTTTVNPYNYRRVKKEILV